MDPRLLDLLRQYIRAAASRNDVMQLVEGYNIWNAWQDDDPAILELREAAGELELLSLEVSEGLRNEHEFRSAADRILKRQPTERRPQVRSGG